MRRPRRALPIVLFVAGAVIGWLGNSLVYSMSSDARLRAPVAGSSGQGGERDAHAVPSETAADPSLPFAGWYEAGFELGSGAEQLENLVRELAGRNREARAFVTAAIETASEEELLEVVGAITHLDPGSMRSSHDPRRFARRLAEVAWDEPLESRPQEGAEPVVAFSRTADPEDLDESSEPVFSRDADRIYAAINLDGYEGRRVMVKWFNRDTRRIETLRSFRYGRDDRGVWAFVSRSAGWEPGSYQVNVYTQDDEMTLIAQGGYSVE